MDEYVNTYKYVNFIINNYLYNYTIIIYLRERVIAVFFLCLQSLNYFQYYLFMYLTSNILIKVQGYLGF